jgi:prepilin-type N-terminal cleavage/methylation domain-containing protein/prepilin-type processing-associated H-X9-DG protein
MIPPHHHPRLRAQFRCGWSLLELLVVIGMMGVLLAIAVPAVQRIRDVGARVKCASNLRQLALAIHLYSDVRNELPQGCNYPFRPSPLQLVGQVGLSWQTSILPYIEQGEVWRLAWQAQQQDPRGHSELHAQVRIRSIAPFLCPTESRQLGGYTEHFRWALTTYLGVAGTGVRRNDGMFHPNYSVHFADIRDGASHTLMIGERPPGPKGMDGAWYAGWGDTVCTVSQILPGRHSGGIPLGAVDCLPSENSLRPGTPDNSCDLTHFWSFHSGGVNFAFADASVRFLRYTQAKILPALATRAGGEIVVLD